MEEVDYDFIFFIIHYPLKSQINQLFPKAYNRSTKLFFFKGTVRSWSQCNSKARLRPVLLISSQLATHSIFHYEKRREKKQRKKKKESRSVRCLQSRGCPSFSSLFTRKSTHINHGERHPRSPRAPRAPPGSRGTRSHTQSARLPPVRPGDPRSNS